MRLLLLSDLHANLAAFEAVLGHASRRGFDAVVCLGDAVGYGPQPREVLTELRKLAPRCVLGNHDMWLLMLAAGEEIPSEGVVGAALRWQLTQLTHQDIAWIASWLDGSEEEYGDLSICFRHGSPLSLSTYIRDLASAREAFAEWDGEVACVGHTHIPAIYVTLQTPSGEWTKRQVTSTDNLFILPSGTRAILNPGSVGQPRDGDPRASYALFDTVERSFEVMRVPYDISRTIAAVTAVGLPEVLGTRLLVGK